MLGQGRSGKTEFVKQLLPKIPSFVVIDTKRSLEDFSDPRWGVVTSDPIAICYHPRVVLQIDLHSSKGIDDFDRALELVYDVRGDPAGRPAVTLLLDEAKHSAPTVPRPLLARIVFSGMGRGIGTWALSQTRYRIYPNLFSDAIWIVAFHVQSARDRAVVGQDIGVDCEQLAQLERHEFVVWRQGDREWRGPYKYELPKR